MFSRQTPRHCTVHGRSAPHRSCPPGPEGPEAEVLVKSGVQVKKRNVEMLFDQGQFWENVDWSKSRAYAMGLGEVYEEKGLYKEATEEYRRVIEIDGKHTGALPGRLLRGPLARTA